MYTYFIAFHYVLNGSAGQVGFGNNILTSERKLNLAVDLKEIKTVIESTEIDGIKPQNVVIINFMEIETLQKNIE